MNRPPEFSDDPKAGERFWLARIFDSLAYPSVVIDTSKRIVGANRKFLDCYSISLEDIVGKKCFHSFLYKDTPCESEDCPISKVLRDKKGHSYTVQRQYKWEDRFFPRFLTMTVMWPM